MPGLLNNDIFLDYGFTSNRIHARESERPNRRLNAIKFHRHNEIELVYVERGDMDIVIGAREDYFETGDFAVFWGAMPHKIFRAKDAVEYWLTLPLAWFLQWDLGDGITKPLLQGAVLKDGNNDASSDFALFQRWDHDIKKNDPEHRAIVLLEVEVRLRRLALSLAEGSGRSRSRRIGSNLPGKSGRAKMDRMVRYIVNHYTEPLTISDVAGIVNLHPDYAVSRFKQVCGIGMVDYWNQLRVSHAQRLLSTTDMKVIDVAMESGFGSASRFYTVFQSVTGMSPRQYRLSVQRVG